MGYQEATGTTFRKSNLDFGTSKTVNQGFLEVCRKGQSCSNPGGKCRGQRVGRNTDGNRQKEY